MERVPDAGMFVGRGTGKTGEVEDRFSCGRTLLFLDHVCLDVRGCRLSWDSRSGRDSGFSEDGFPAKMGICWEELRSRQQVMGAIHTCGGRVARLWKGGGKDDEKAGGGRQDGEEMGKRKRVDESGLLLF